MARKWSSMEALRNIVARDRTLTYSEHEAARERLLALEAVARAAEDHSHAEIEPSPEPDGEARACPICRALARLRRASGGKP